MSEQPREGIDPNFRQTEDGEHFIRDEHEGWWLVKNQEGVGFNALVVHVQGRHPEKTVLSGRRNYYVIDGSGLFSVDGQDFSVHKGSMVIVEQGSTYSYEGQMQLFEFNVDPTNQFSDEKTGN